MQHDDLHTGSVCERAGRYRVLDWGDTSISHPFFSLIVTFRFLEEHTGLPPESPWFARLSAAYLEPWGPKLHDSLGLALRVGRFAHAVGWSRHRQFLGPPHRAALDGWFAHILRRALQVVD